MKFQLPVNQDIDDCIVLHLIDGQRGDNDLSANGVIVDPGLPSVDDRDRPWQNPNLAVNVNDDNAVSPLDALLIINELNRGLSRNLPVPRPLPILLANFFDVSGDNVVSPLDALLVINDLNTNGPRDINSEGEGEALDAVAVENLLEPLAVLSPADGTSVMASSMMSLDDSAFGEKRERNPSDRSSRRIESHARHALNNDWFFLDLSQDRNAQSQVDSLPGRAKHSEESLAVDHIFTLFDAAPRSGEFMSSDPD